METERRVQRAGVSPPYWIITRSEELSIEFSGRRRRSEAYREILTLRAEGSKVLPLFGSEEQASSFVEAFVSYTGEGGWRITQVWAGELFMLLSAGAAGRTAERGGAVGPLDRLLHDFASAPWPIR